MIRALYGGSFDPFHEGHFKLIEALLDRRLCDHVHVIPAHVSPFKSKVGASSMHRLAMVQAALGGMTSVTVEDLEVQRGGPSWTVETLDSLRLIYPGDTWRLVMGADSVCGFDQWRDASRILTNSRPIVFSRDHTEVHGMVALADPIIVTDFKAPVSSSDIRTRLMSGEREHLQLPPPVLDYILRHDLYRSPGTTAGG
jgi:nicotinate-nucleotide adenylyltransferase